MALPHPESRKDKDGQKDKPNGGGIVWEFFERAVDVAENRNAEDEVSPARERTLGGRFHDRFVIPLSAKPKPICSG